MATILVVDDVPTNLKVLSESIARCGWKILVALDGEGAIEQARYAHPDLVLLDVMMPGIDGFETCQRFKDDETLAEIPIIFMTALSDPVDKVRGLELGAVDYITKPFQAEEAIARVRVHLRLRELTRALGRQNEMLETQVAARTRELEAALAQLKASQVQLVQSEKMSALGELAAGAIHEIKNQILVLTGNAPIAADSVHDVLAHLRLYRAAYPEPTGAIAAHAAEIDLDYLLEDLPKLADSLREASARAQETVSAVMTFSYRDSGEKTSFDLHEGLESTLAILRHRLKGNRDRPAIEVVRDYGELVPVECFPGQLNQVFMNLLVNAIDALEESNQSRSFDEIVANPNCIEISTGMGSIAGERAATVTFRDNGLGMSDRVRQMLFKQSFTTKPVGKGTGLGLQISRRIVEEVHQGKLFCTSAPGRGTAFAIALPVSSPLTLACESQEG